MCSMIGIKFDDYEEWSIAMHSIKIQFVELNKNDGIHETGDQQHEQQQQNHHNPHNSNESSSLKHYIFDASKFGRHKRQADQYEYTPTKTRCPLLLVADYRFFQEMGSGNTKTTINYLVSID